MMPVQELGPHFQFASWRVPQFPRAIEYPSEVMEEIRAFASDELLQLSHGGEEVGGVLFGTRREELLRILTWRPIACDHTRGEGLLLSYNDRMNLAVQLEMARQNPDLKDLRPLGWFVSHLRDVSMSASDLEIYNGFFPEASQVSLVICPQKNGGAKAGFFVREADGNVQSEASYHCFEVEPLRPAPRSAPGNDGYFAAETVPAAATPVATVDANSNVVQNDKVAEPEAQPAERGRNPQALAAGQVVQEQAAQVVREQVVHARESEAQTPAPHREPPRDRPNFAARADLIRRTKPPEPLSAEETSPLVPSFQTEEAVPSHERWLWAIPIVLALGIAAFMLHQRHPPVASGTVGLRAWSEAQTVQLAWDANSSAIRDADHAAMEINDGGKSSQISFNADQLHAGKMSYLPESGDVGFTMTVYPANGDPIHDYTRLIAPNFTAPVQATQPDPANAAPTNPLPASPATASSPPSSDAAQSSLQLYELQKEVGRLKDDLGKERARADELQNLVRILENRLGISTTGAKTQRRR